MNATLAIVDDDAGYRAALAWYLGREGFVVADFPDADSFIAGFAPDALGCVLLDLRLADADGIDVIQRARQAEIDAPVIIMTAFADIPSAVRSLRAGAYSFVAKPAGNGELLRVVEDATNAHREARRRFGPATGVLSRYRTLTARERDAFWSMADGCTIKEIARELGISEKTAEIHRSRVLAKMTATSLSDIVKSAHHVRMACEGRPNTDKE